MYCLELINIEDFGMRYATITVLSETHCILYTKKNNLITDDWISKTELGAKQIFGKNYGKGGIWKIMHLPESNIR